MGSPVGVEKIKSVLCIKIRLCLEGILLISGEAIIVGSQLPGLRDFPTVHPVRQMKNFLEQFDGAFLLQLV